MKPLRLVILDATDTCARRRGGPLRAVDGTLRGSWGLTPIWRLGAVMHRGVRRADASCAATGWREALRWAADQSRVRRAPIAEVQVWGHGGWGFMRLGDERLDASTIAPGGPLGESIDALRSTLARDALVWLRCCSAFGTAAGHRLAKALSDRLRARVAGHTHIIGAWQSGTHSLAPGRVPTWSTTEGVDHEAARQPCAMFSSRGRPHTVSCMALGLPDGW